MSFTVVGWDESQDTSNALTFVAALVDQSVTTNGDTIRVPSHAPRIAAALALGATITRARISAPSLRKKSNIDLAPINIGIEPDTPTPYLAMWERPRTLTVGESLRAEASENAAGAERATILAWLLATDPQPVPEGEIQTVRIDFTTTLTANVWSIATGTMAQDLEAGRYAIVGGRGEAAGLQAWRLVIPGSEYRPGAIGYDAADDVEDRRFRYGGLGVSWGEFEHDTLPQVEFLSNSADTSETVWLDLVLVREGPSAA